MQITWGQIQQVCKLLSEQGRNDLIKPFENAVVTELHAQVVRDITVPIFITTGRGEKDERRTGV
jgi:hypothetical protein